LPYDFAAQIGLATGCRMIFILEVSHYRLALQFDCKHS
jgi:hypothetical protein